MKIIFHHRIRSQDGQYIHLREMLEAFKSIGHEVILVGPNISKEKATFGKGGELVSWIRQYLPRWTGEIFEIIYGIWAAARLLYVIILQKPNFVYERFNLFSVAGALICRLLKVRLVLEVNAPLYEERMKHGGLTLKKIAKWTQTHTWKSADLCCPVSGVLSKTLIEYGVKKEKIIVLHNGIDKKRFNGENDKKIAKRRLGLEEFHILGFIGFVRDWHRVDLAIKALKNESVPHNTVIVIAGEGPELNKLKYLTKQLDLEERVKFLGLIHWETVPKVLAAFDIALQPAVTEYASPLKLIEYLASGAAIIAPNQQNIKELITHNENGWIVDNDSEKSIEEAIHILMNNQDLRARLGHQALETIARKELTWIQNARKVTYFINRLVKK
jgi:glycosyltransferase involved in cell wall biosynthesis